MARMSISALLGAVVGSKKCHETALEEIGCHDDGSGDIAEITGRGIIG